MFFAASPADAPSTVSRGSNALAVAVRCRRAPDPAGHRRGVQPQGDSGGLFERDRRRRCRVPRRLRRRSASPGVAVGHLDAPRTKTERWQHGPVDLLHASAQRSRDRLHQSAARVLADRASRRVRAGRGRIADRCVSPGSSRAGAVPRCADARHSCADAEAVRGIRIQHQCAHRRRGVAATSPPTSSSTRSASPTTTIAPTSISAS